MRIVFGYELVLLLPLRILNSHFLVLGSCLSVFLEYSFLMKQLSIGKRILLEEKGPSCEPVQVLSVKAYAI